MKQRTSMPRTGTCIVFSALLSFALVVPPRAAEKQGQQAAVEMHHPEAWQFRLPKGYPAKGREVYKKFECYSCHEVRGENFPAPEGDAVGPELSQMGPLHPVEYFTESIVNPSVLVEKRYRGPDGKSKMPSFNEDMTVQELIDLSAYLASLKPKEISRTATGEGKVVAVVADSQQVLLEHGEIKGFMGAMTMGYRVESPKLLQGLKPGDRVRFTINTDTSAIIQIVKE
ncbi:MAG: copper-binding protein [Deltaproteobacteria bacterium]|nr:copper-binding protein [Deltaproteobacteria bacterium]